jgi:predicted RNA-binding Zn-ribbon protein involved in translation (DUF1610 family)
MTITTRRSATNPENKQEPMWFRIGRRRTVSDEFKNDPRRACLNQVHIMFSEDLCEQVMAKKLCASCRLFKECALWSLNAAEWEVPEFGIIAGMDPDQRRRIRERREHFWDWRRDFNYTQRVARAAARKRETERHRAEIPLCPGCGSNYDVIRDRWNRSVNQQRYHCTACGSYFVGGGR